MFADINSSVNITSTFMISLASHQVWGFLKTYLNKLQAYCNLLGKSGMLGTEKKTMFNSHILRQ